MDELIKPLAETLGWEERRENCLFFNIYELVYEQNKYRFWIETVFGYIQIAEIDETDTKSVASLLNILTKYIP